VEWNHHFLHSGTVHFLFVDFWSKQLVQFSRKAGFWFASWCVGSVSGHFRFHVWVWCPDRDGKCIRKPCSKAGPKILQHLACGACRLVAAVRCAALGCFQYGSLRSSMGDRRFLHPEIF